MKHWIILLAIAELGSVITIAHLWSQKRKNWLMKLGWTLFLLVPLFGPIFYCFVTINPEAHGEEPTGGPWTGE